MKRASRACRAAAAVFGIVAVLHAWRLITHTPVVVGTWEIPMELSWVGLGVAGGLAWWLWNASRS